MMERSSGGTPTDWLPKGRYKKLAEATLARLPAGWDRYRVLTFELGGSDRETYGSAVLADGADGSDLESHHEQGWDVFLCPGLLDGLSDDAVCWVIAHELAHVAAGLTCDALRSSRPDAFAEKVADAIARAWGFWLEEEAFDAATGSERG